MKKLYNIVSILILSISILSCSKEKENIVPVTQQEIIGDWSISEIPEINIVNGGDYPVIDTLNQLFKIGDRYHFDSDSCTITRTSDHKIYKKIYRIESSCITFDGYIKFQTNISGDKLILTAGDAEIKETVKKELRKSGSLNEVMINRILGAVSGSVKLVFKKNSH
ncbi:MAG: hypothetical protein LBQ01_01400 [Prevotellaceae bacterium]|jgi:hypothetical protein|nr:hypothetical protein [Prevotellaceae bacterium]